MTIYINPTKTNYFNINPTKTNSVNIFPPAICTIWDQVANTYEQGYISNGTFTAATITKFPIHDRMRRCVVTDAGAVNYYLDPTNSTKKADGSAAVLDGTDGQVMVAVPTIYYLGCMMGISGFMLSPQLPFGIASQMVP